MMAATGVLDVVAALRTAHVTPLLRQQPEIVVDGVLLVCRQLLELRAGQVGMRGQTGAAQVDLASWARKLCLAALCHAVEIDPCRAYSGGAGTMKVHDAQVRVHTSIWVLFTDQYILRPVSRSSMASWNSFHSVEFITALLQL
jgi:hypothetical protein